MRREPRLLMVRLGVHCSIDPGVTMNAHPGAQVRVEISAGTSRNPARQCEASLLHQVFLGGFPAGTCKDNRAGSSKIC